MKANEIVSYLRAQNRISAKAQGLVEVVAAWQSLMALDFVRQRGIDREENFKVGAMTLVHPIPRLTHFALAWNLGVGAPQAILNLEVLAELGLRRLVCLGYVGSLDPDLRIGEVVCIHEAVSDEGTSRHYGAADCGVASVGGDLDNFVIRHGFDSNVPRVRGWTVDAPCAVSEERRREVISLGAQVVDMEASAVMQWGKARDIEVAIFGVVSDHDAGGVWKPSFHEGSVRSSAVSALRSIVKVCALSSFAR